MLVSDIITMGRNLADIGNTNFYSATEALQAVQLSYKQLYELLCEADDDYYITQLIISSTSFTPAASAPYSYLYALPTDFYRLRLFQFRGLTTLNFAPVYKATMEELGSSGNTPSYRFQQNNLFIFDPSSFPTYRLWYYPVAATLTTSTDIVYPNSLIPEIMAYQLAVEIRRKQGLDLGYLESRKKELGQTMKDQLKRDDNKAEHIKNVFARRSWPYV